LAVVGLLGYSVGHLGLTLFGPDVVVEDDAVVVASTTLQKSTVVETPADMAWPALFGVYDPQPPGVVKAPVVKKSQSAYRLKGLFSGEISSWAIIEDGTGEYLIREGDALSNGEIATKIDDAGVTIEVDGDLTLISFEGGE
jgi:type II secretory pathway component PulC